MTKQDIIAVKEAAYTKELFFDPEKSAVVCAKHNTEKFGGRLKARKFSRGARCLYCIREGK